MAVPVVKYSLEIVRSAPKELDALDDPLFAQIEVGASQDILKARRVLFLGAGSSKPPGKKLIYPATRKVAIEDPYFTAYDYLEKCLTCAELYVVVGYSFRDYDCVMRFKAAKLANPNLSVLLVDPWAGKISKEIGEAGVEAEPLPLLFPLQENQCPHLAELIK